MAEAALTLPEDIIHWIEDETGGVVTATNRVPGGASREAWFIDVKRDGATDPLFLRYSRAERPDDTAFLPLRVEAEVFMALQDTDVTVPRTLAVHPEHEAMLSERISGENWFYRIQDPDEQVRVAQDFIRNLAALHRLDPHDLALPSFGPVKTVREHALDEIANMRRRATQPSGDIDPLAAPQPRLAGAQRARLRRPGRLRPGRHRPRQLHVRERQGHRGRRLGARPLRRPDGRHRVAVVAHRPRHVHALPRPAARVREAVGQHRSTRERVWYYRLFAETRLTSNSAGAGGWARRPGEGQPVARDIGNGIIYGMLHRRLTIEALAAAMGFELPAVELPDEPPPEPWHAYYDATLDNLQIIVPRIEDKLASQWTKGVARILKYLKEVDRSGRAFARRRARRHRGAARSRTRVPRRTAGVSSRVPRARARSATRSTCGTCGVRCSATTT